jgi:hypothetical protein
MYLGKEQVFAAVNSTTEPACFSLQIQRAGRTWREQEDDAI